MKKKWQKNILVYTVFLAISLLVFWPVFHKNFVSDDFQVLYRIAIQRIFFIKGFFRPLSDISLYGSYLMGGFNPFYYNIVNIFIHAGNAFLLYCFCMQYQFAGSKNAESFSFLTAFMFLIYPFHNEAVVWAIGRGIVLSGFFGFLSLLVVFLKISNRSKYIFSCLFYFISLCGYETALPLPLIILLFLYTKDNSFAKLIKPALGYFLTLLLNLLLRFKVAGVIVGGYGNSIFSCSAREYAIKFLKSAGRLFLPPSEFSFLLSGLFILLGIGAAISAIIIVKKRNVASKIFLAITMATILSFIIPSAFGISTKTYEGDRIFYFSSFFLCLWIVYQLSLIQNEKIRTGVSFFVAGYFLLFFFQSLMNWKNGAAVSDRIISTIGHLKRGSGRIYILNIPEEYNGAQVLRNGFYQALLINNIDTAGIKPVNYLSSEYAFKMAGDIRVKEEGEKQIIYPFADISGDTLTARIWNNKKNNDSVYIKLNAVDKIYYWNKKSLVVVAKPQ